MAESFFATLEWELLARNRFQTREEAEHEVFAFIEGWEQHPALAFEPGLFEFNDGNACILDYEDYP